MPHLALAAFLFFKVFQVQSSIHRAHDHAATTPEAFFGINKGFVLVGRRMILHFDGIKATLVDTEFTAIAEFQIDDGPIATFRYALAKLIVFNERSKHIAAAGAARADYGHRWCSMYQPLLFSVAQNPYCLFMGNLSTGASANRVFGSFVELETDINRAIT